MASGGGVAANVTEVGNAIDNDEWRGCNIGGIHNGQRGVVFLVRACTQSVCVRDRRVDIQKPTDNQKPDSTRTLDLGRRANYSFTFSVLDAVEHMEHIRAAVNNAARQLRTLMR